MTKWLNENILIKYWEDRCSSYKLPDGRKILKADRNPSFGAYPDILRNELDTGEVVPCEIEWETTNFKKHGHDIELLIQNGGFLLTFIENSAFDVPQIKIIESDFIEWFCNDSKKIVLDTVNTVKKRAIKRIDPFVWIIYISTRGSKNYEVALEKGIWGFAETDKRKRRGADMIKDIRKNDFIIFIKVFQSDENNRIKTPRIKDKSKFIGNISEITGVRVTRGYYFDEKNNSIWSDKKYPHRFDFDRDFLFKGTKVPFNPKNFGEYLHKQIANQINANTLQHINSTMLLKLMTICSENR
ncbi:hypothetical protein K1514_06340 [Paraclostridium bifermentans]|uniref:hypothetical protein n=1 Tax=Paraclostridium TaxID=1849822 RepID=UPI001CC78EA3|nr:MULTISPECIES: hypothetical protein [Paraclostridium]MBZ6005500.1 hypothetical protein [Paraclostridium bifermentans]MDU0297971.1 hypothetical protein [Paraclostridium sp. MRS3W1]